MKRCFTQREGARQVDPGRVVRSRPTAYKARMNDLLQAVIPAKAGIHFNQHPWIPAFSPLSRGWRGMTGLRGACAGVSADRGSQAELCT